MRERRTAVDWAQEIKGLLDIKYVAKAEKALLVMDNLNRTQKGVDWQFTTKDARIKLKRLYLQIQS